MLPLSLLLDVKVHSPGYTPVLAQVAQIAEAALVELALVELLLPLEMSPAPETVLAKVAKHIALVELALVALALVELALVALLSPLELQPALSIQSFPGCSGQNVQVCTLHQLGARLLHTKVGRCPPKCNWNIQSLCT